MVGVSVEDAAVNVLLEGRILLLEGRIPLLLWNGLLNVLQNGSLTCALHLSIVVNPNMWSELYCM